MRSGSIFPFLLTAACLPFPAASWAADDQVGSDDKMDAKPAELIAIGLPSEWDRPFQFWDLIDRGRDAECVPFLLRSLRPKAEQVVVTTMGIAGARLAAGKVGENPACPKPAPKTLLSLKARLGPGEDAVAYLFVPEAAFPLTSDAAKGQLMIVSQTGEPVSIAINLKRQPPAIMWQAVQWLVGIAIPLLIGGAITLWFGRWQKRGERSDEERGTLKEFQRAKQDELQAFFASLYHNIKEEPATAPDRMQRELTDKGIMSALPAKAGGRVTQNVRLGLWHKLDKELAKLFPDQRALILKKGR